MSDFHPAPDPSHPPSAPLRAYRRAAVAAFLAPIALLAGLVVWLAIDDGPRPDPGKFSEAAVLQRIAPVARHVTASREPGADTPDVPGEPAAGSPAAGAEAAIGMGQKLYQSVCFACHATGVADAPVLGDRKAWAPYLATGTEAMLQAVMQGKGAMPPKGGADEATEQELRAAIDYLTAAAR